MTKIEDFSKQEDKRNYTGVRRKKPIVECESLKCDSEQKGQNAELDKIKKQSKQSTQSQSVCGKSWFFLPISGMIGGIIALSLWVGIQWAGFVPSSLLFDHVGGEKALQIAETAKSQTEKTMGELEHILQEIDVLKAKVPSLISQQAEIIQDDEISHKRKTKVFLALEEKINNLEEQVQTFKKVSKDVQTALLIGKDNADDLTALKQKLEHVQKEIVVKNDEKKEVNTAVFIAINSLKNAIERGGSYINELKMLQQLLPSVNGIDLLQKTAATGFPSPAKFSDDFSSVADAIVGTKNIVASDAGFFERMLAWIKGLVVSRPVGNVEGMTLGAIAARMEFAIQMGDYEKALAEWKTLPKSAKDVSVNFIHKLETYIAVQQLLQQLLMAAQQGSL